MASELFGILLWLLFGMQPSAKVPMSERAKQATKEEWRAVMKRR